MAWSVIGDTYSTSEFDNYSKLQPVIFNDNTILRYARTWVIVYNNPTFTDLKLKIFSYNESGTKGKELYVSSTTWTKVLITSENNAVREIFFQFDDIPLNGDNTYYFAVGGSSAAFTSSAHMAWKKGWPDPVYTTGVSTTYPSAGSNPYDIYYIGAKH